MPDNFYGQIAWHKLRAKVKRRGTCAKCGGHTRGKYNAHVDHIIPRKKRPDLALDIRNLQLLCSRCHNSLKKMEEQSTMAPTAEDGMPTDPSHPWNTT